MSQLWHPMETAPRGRPIIVYCPERHGLQAMASICEWHPDAGFCVDELREPTCWTEIPRVALSQTEAEEAKA
jgi:hypothetical protein